MKKNREPAARPASLAWAPASGVTLFVPMSIVTGSSNNVYGIDNDTGYVVWQHFDALMLLRRRPAQEGSSLLQRASSGWMHRPPLPRRAEFRPWCGRIS
jgi:hypothetical protein